MQLVRGLSAPVAPDTLACATTSAKMCAMNVVAPVPATNATAEPLLMLADVATAIEASARMLPYTYADSRAVARSAGNGPPGCWVRRRYHLVDFTRAADRLAVIRPSSQVCQ